jgi:hypothetical protein
MRAQYQRAEQVFLFGEPLLLLLDNGRKSSQNWSSIVESRARSRICMGTRTLIRRENAVLRINLLSCDWF